MHVVYLSRQEIQIAAMCTEVDEGLAIAEQSKLIGVTANGGTVHLG